MGKYTHLRHKLPAFETSEEAKGMEAWYAKVKEWTLEFLGTTDGKHANPVFLAMEYAKRYLLKKSLEDQISEINIELEGLSRLGVDCLEEAGMQKADLSTGGYVSIKDTPYTSIKDRTKVFDWVKKEKMESILTVNYQTLNGLNNERVLAAINAGKAYEKALVPGTKIFMKTKLSVSSRVKDED